MKSIQEYIKQAPAMSDYDRKFYAPRVIEIDMGYLKPPTFHIWRHNLFGRSNDMPGNFKTRESAERKLTSIMGI